MSIGVAAAVVGGLVLGACFFNYLSKRERKRQERLEENYRDYRRQSNAAYRNILSRRQSHLDAMRQKTAHELYLLRMQAIEERKARNRKNFEILMDELVNHIAEREKLADKVREIIESMKSAKNEEQSAGLRQESLHTILNESYNSLNSQKAYISYLKKYQKLAERNFNYNGELTEPFSMTLPEYAPYFGKIIGFDREDLLNGEFEKNIHVRCGYKFLCKDAEEIDVRFPDSEIIYCMVDGYNKEKHFNILSCVKGMFLHQLMQKSDSLFEAKVKSHEQSENGNIIAYILDIKGVDVKLHISNCKDRRPVPVSSRKMVYIKNFDQNLLQWANATERIEDCLRVENFKDVPLMVYSQDVDEFSQTIHKKEADKTYDKWYLGPVIEGYENVSDSVKYKCQLGNKVVFQVYFSKDNFPKLYFEKFLPDSEMFAANDIFVAVDANLNAKLAEKVEEISPDVLHESLNFFIYLNGEFAKQSRIRSNQENILYFNQWSAVMKRLIKIKESADSIVIKILEQTDSKTFLLEDDSVSKLKKFYKQQDNSEFFIRIDDDKKVFVKICEDFTTLKTKIALRENFLETVGYEVEIHALEIPYPEIMQYKALENFRRGIMHNPSLKESIFNLSKIPFEDCGVRPKNIRNKSILENESQLCTIVKALAAKNFFMIQGPPGTGKTTVIKEIIWQQIRLQPQSRILIVSQANVAVDNVLRGLPSLGIEKNSVVRCGNNEKISEDMKEFSLDSRITEYMDRLKTPCREDLQIYRDMWCSMINDAQEQGFIGEYMLKNFSIIGATCVGLEKKHFGLERLTFDLVIIDEAGKATPGELLLPINRANKVIILGDHKQLPPVVDPAFFDKTKLDINDIVDDEKINKFFATSLFEKLYTACPSANKSMLNIQFRMPSNIGKMISNLFYDDKLVSNKSCEVKTPIFFGNNIVFVNMENDPKYFESQATIKNGGRSGPYNEREISAVVALLKRFTQHFNERIAIITPYKQQKKHLRLALKQFEFNNVVVDTIDSFQGDEADIVFYCTTRSRKPTDYFSDSARLNVAFSRTKNLLVIIGSLKYFREKYPEGHVMGRIANYIETNGYIVSGEKIFTEDFEIPFSAPPSAVVVSNSEIDFGENFVDPQIIEKYIPKNNLGQYVCKICLKSFDSAEYLLDGICSDCLEDGELYKCKHCHKDMLYTNAQRYIYHQNKEELCDDCKIIWRHTCTRCKKNEVIVRARDLRNSQQPKIESDFPYCPQCLKERKKEIVVGNCKVCGKEISYRQGKIEDLQAEGKKISGYCHDCCQSEEIGHCRTCNKPLIYSKAKIHELKTNGKKISEYCYDCRNEQVTVGCCKICGKPLIYSKAKIHELRSKGYSEPRRCKECKRN